LISCNVWGIFHCLPTFLFTGTGSAVLASLRLTGCCPTSSTSSSSLLYCLFSNSLFALRVFIALDIVFNALFCSSVGLKFLFSGIVG